jgi:hypothetical protein
VDVLPHAQPQAVAAPYAAARAAAAIDAALAGAPGLLVDRLLAAAE